MIFLNKVIALTGNSPSLPSPIRGRSLLSVSSQLGKGVCKIPSQTRGGLGWGATASFVTLNLIQSRIVGRIAKGGIILKPSMLAGDSGSEAGVTIQFCHSELDSESHSLTDCKGRNNFKTLWI